MNVKLPNGTNEDPFVDLYADPKNVITAVLPERAHDNKTVRVPAQPRPIAPQPAPIATPPIKVEAWWQDPAKWLKILTPLVVVVWCFYLGFYFASPANVPDTLVPPGMRQEAQVPQHETTKPSARPTQHQVPSTQTAQVPEYAPDTSKSGAPQMADTTSPSALPSPAASPETSSAPPTPEETLETPPGAQQPTPTQESPATPSEAPVIPSSEPSPEPSIDGGEEQVTSEDPAVVAPPE